MNEINPSTPWLKRSVMILILGLVAGLFWFGVRNGATQAVAGTPLATHAVDGPGAGKTDAATTHSAATAHEADSGTSASRQTELVNVFGDDPLESLAQSLKRRQRDLDARERQLADEAQRIETLRKEVEQNLTRSQQVLKQMQQLAGNAAAQRDKELARWIKIYEGMTPIQAGQVLAQLDLDFARELLTKMDPKKASKILSAFPPDKAVELSRRLKDKSNS